MTSKRSAVKDRTKKAQVTGGDKGSKKTNDFETSGRDVEKRVRGTQANGSAQDRGKAGRERTTEAGVVASNETKNHSQIKAQPEPGNPGRKPKKTAKGERGSRKPGTELTKDELANQAS